MNESPFPASWLKGLLDLAVLAVISRGETYGYELAQDLGAAGFGEIKGGTLYPALARLEEAGLAVATWRAGQNGPGRKYYALTPDGHAELADRSTSWIEFSTALTNLLEEAS